MAALYRLSHAPEIVYRDCDSYVQCVYDRKPAYEVLWDEYQAWLTAGNTPDPYTPPEPPPPPTVQSAGPTLEERVAALEQVLRLAQESQT